MCVDYETLLLKESIWINSYIDDPLNMNFNDTSVGFATGERNYNSTEEGKNKLRQRMIENNPMKGRKHSPETIEKLRAASTGKKHSDETLEKMGAAISKSRTGIRYSDEGRKKLSESRKKDYVVGLRQIPNFSGHEHSIETIEKMKTSHLDRRREQCPHCGKIAAVNTYVRWHGNNCKEYIIACEKLGL